MLETNCLQFSQGNVFFYLSNLQKRATKSDTSGHCLLISGKSLAATIFSQAVAFWQLFKKKASIVLLRDIKTNYSEWSLWTVSSVSESVGHWQARTAARQCQLCFSRVLCRHSLWGRFISSGPATAGAAPAVAATPAASAAQCRHAGAGSWSQHHDPKITIPICATVSKKDQNNQLDSYLWLLLPPQFR